MFHPSTNSSGFGRSFGSPSGAPASTHFTSVSRSACDIERSLRKWPNCGSANHGGIFWVRTACFMALAQGRASLYVSIENGAASPGRWQPWQFFCKTEATSLVNVTEDLGAPDAIAATPAASNMSLIVPLGGLYIIRERKADGSGSLHVRTKDAYRP